MDKFLSEIVQQNIQIKPRVFNHNVVQIFKKLRVKHLLHMACPPDEHQVSLCDFLMLLQSLNGNLFDILEVQLGHCALGVVCVQFHFKNLAVTHVSDDLWKRGDFFEDVLSPSEEELLTVER